MNTKHTASVTRTVWPWLLATGVLLGLGLPLSKLAAGEGIDALTFAYLPTTVAALVLAMLAHRHQPLGRPEVRLLRFGAIAGLFGHALPMTAAYWLSARAGSGFTAIAFTLPPVFTLAVTLLLRLEPLRWQRVGAVALGLGGALVLALGSARTDGVASAALLLVIAIPALIGGANVYRSLHLPDGIRGEWLAALTLGSSAAILAAIAAARGGLTAPTTATGALVLATQALALVAGYIAYFGLQRRAEPVAFSFMGYVTMLTGVVAGTALLGERLPPAAWPALALIVAGYAMLRRSASRAAAATAETRSNAPERWVEQPCRNP